MANNWLVFGGWSLPPHIVSGVFGNCATYIDVNKLFTEIIAHESIRSDWGAIIFDRVKPLITTLPISIAGWSTGAFFAYALSPLINPLSLTLLSGSPSFCKRGEFLYGQEPGSVKVMRRQLLRNKTLVLQNFQKQCGLFSYDSSAEQYSTAELTAGLTFLEHISLLPLQKPPCSVKMFHGEGDTIIPATAAEFFAEKICAAKTILPGGHAFFCASENTQSIRNAIA